MDKTSPHIPDCAWERTASADCEYRDTHHYCPHPEHACTCLLRTKPLSQHLSERMNTANNVLGLLLAASRDEGGAGIQPCVQTLIEIAAEREIAGTLYSEPLAPITAPASTVALQQSDDLAQDVIRELDRQAFLHNSNATCPIAPEEVERIAEVIRPLLAASALTAREDRIHNAAFNIASAFPELNYSGKPINPDGELVLRIAGIISADIVPPSPAAIRDASPTFGYERALTSDWETHNARRHELIEAKRSRLLSETEITELVELQWLAGIKRALVDGPVAIRDKAELHDAMERDAMIDTIKALEGEINAAWLAIERGWEIEPRSHFEEEAPKNGFESPLAMAVHYMWKWETKAPSTRAKAAAEEIQKQFSNYVPHVFIDKFAAIIERYLAGGGETEIDE